ncbi:MAG: class I SAM-dependent RNA methyltransferase [Sandaracinaceae bacterium]|nr:class I SAM-dependent RNA methyltransferase [Sandaracinaceae bacterium]
MSSFEAVIEGIGRHGEGYIERDGRRLYLDGMLPGDRVRLSVARTGKPRLLRLIESSPHRIEPACEIADFCGGCALISLDYERALEEKERLLREAAEIDASNEAVETSATNEAVETSATNEAVETSATNEAVDAPPQRAESPRVQANPNVRMHPSSETLGYRRRARLAFNARRGTLGYRARRSNALVDAPACPILTRRLEVALPALRSLIRSFQGRGEITLGDTLDGIYATIDAEDFQPPSAYEALAALAASPGWAGIAFRIAGVPTPSIWGRTSERHRAADGLDLETPPGGFLQVNAGINAALARRVAEWAEPEGASIVELFSGAGNLSVLLAPGAASLLAIEEYAPASEYARTNLKRRGQHAKLVASRVEEVSLPRGDVLVLNPPRSGYPGLRRALHAVRPERVVLVSCDLGSLRRELRTLRSEGYELIALEGFDMFPRTPHLEAAALLRPALADRPR